MSGMPEPMSGDEFRMQMALVANAAKILVTVDMDRLWDMVERAETLGPLFEPTAYMRGGADNLRDQAELLRAAAALRAAALRIVDRAIDRQRIAERAKGGAR